MSSSSSISTPTKDAVRKRKRTEDGNVNRSEKRTVEIKKTSVKSKVDTRQDARAAFYAEENEVLQRDPTKDLELYKNACNEIRRCMAEIHQLKSSDSKTKVEEIEELRVNACLQFVAIKRLNRLSHLRCKKVRDNSTEARQKTDQFHLQLQNLLYEVMHLQKEITKCLEFKSKDEEIELVDLEEFYKEAPVAITKPNKTKADVHLQTLSRLDWELEQRIRLSGQLKETQESKEVIAEDIKTKKEYLDSLQPKLKNILESTKPVQEYLDMPFDEIREQHSNARHLPEPLYVLFMQATAYHEACDKKLSVCLEGDVDAAKALSINTTEDNDEEDEDEEEEEESSKRKSKHRRKTVSDRMTQKKEKVLKKHPMTVVLTVQCADGNKLKLIFSYLLTLRIATVSVKTEFSKELNTSISEGDLLSSSCLLSCLYPEDHGNATPNPANKYELEQVGIDDITNYITEIGHPYMWVQWLSGLQFLTAPGIQRAQCAVSAGHMQETIKRIRQRIQARIALQKHLSALEQGSVLLDSQSVKKFTIAKMSCRLVSWRRSTYEDFVSLANNKWIMDAGLVKETDMFFTTQVERGSAKLTASVVISPDYPSSVPLFTVEILWKNKRNNLNDENMTALEAELNVHYKDLLDDCPRHQILANQMQRMLMCFDVYLETEVDNSDVDGPCEFSRDRVFSRPARGPSRVKPYKYNSYLGTFQQR